MTNFHLSSGKLPAFIVRITEHTFSYIVHSPTNSLLLDLEKFNLH